MTQTTTDKVLAANVVREVEAFKEDDTSKTNQNNCNETPKGVIKNIDRMHYFAHLMSAVGSIAQSRFLSKSPRPFSLSHMVTNTCNSDCPYCFWKHHKKDNELSTDEIKRIYKEAKHEGFVTSILWGGEPLLREDFPELCKASQDNGMYTKVATNGYFLKDRPDYASYADLTFVSIDAIGCEHDNIRRTKGLFDRAYNGIAHLREHYPKMRVYICHCVSSENDGNIEKVAQMAKDLGVLLYFVVNKSNQDFEDWQGKNEVKQYEKTDEQLSEDFKLIKELKRKGFPIRNSDYFMDYIINKKNYYTCHWPKVTLVMYSDGKVLRCCDRKPIADLRKNSLGEVIKSSEYRYIAENSSNCKLACVGNYAIDSSGLWNFEYQAYKSIAQFAIV